MADDKQIIAVLLDALEEAFVDRVVFNAMLRTICENFPQLGPWQPVFENLKAEGQQAVRQKFLVLREAVNRSRDLEQALKQFLRDTEPKGPVQ